MFDKKQLLQFEKIATPFYYYDLALLNATLLAITSEASLYDFDLHYALKANSNRVLLKAIQAAGLGADCVSGNEVLRALEVGFEANRIVFAGVGKSDAELCIGLSNGIGCFNCESMQELEVLNDLALKLNTVARVALRINPNIRANTHHYITTGLAENKFGIQAEDLGAVLDKLSGLKAIALSGIHFHIGSQITELNVFEKLCIKINELTTWLKDKGIALECINVGGGLGVDYHAPDANAVVDFKAYFQLFNRLLKREVHQRVQFEPGRSIVAQCGALISRVLYIKKGQTKHFVILDAGMTELIRPALYQSFHKIENLSASNEQAVHRSAQIYEVVGPICETSDSFGKEVILPETHRGDLIAIRSTGAYGETMASGYNLRDKAKCVYSTQL